MFAFKAPFVIYCRDSLQPLLNVHIPIGRNLHLPPASSDTFSLLRKNSRTQDMVLSSLRPGRASMAAYKVLRPSEVCLSNCMMNMKTKVVETNRTVLACKHGLVHLYEYGENEEQQCKGITMTYSREALKFKQIALQVPVLGPL